MTKKQLFEEIQVLSEDINKRIIETGIDFEDDYEGDRNREIVEVELEEDENAVLILGINPSINRGNGEALYPNINFLKCVNDEETIPDFISKYTNQYHMERYKYYFKGYSLMWEKEAYLNKYIEEYSNIEDEEYKIKDIQVFKDYLMKHRTYSKNYALFSDILHLKVTEAAKVDGFLEESNEKLMKQKELNLLQEDIFRLFEMQIEYYNPKLVWINKKNLKDFLQRFFIKEGVKITPIYKRQYKKSLKDTIFRAEYKGIPFYFSNFFSGGAMTTQEKRVLKEAIDKDLQAMNMLY